LTGPAAVLGQPTLGAFIEHDSAAPPGGVAVGAPLDGGRALLFAHGGDV